MTGHFVWAFIRNQYKIYYSLGDQFRGQVLMCSICKRIQLKPNPVSPVNHNLQVPTSERSAFPFTEVGGPTGSHTCKSRDSLHMYWKTAVLSSRGPPGGLITGREDGEEALKAAKGRRRGTLKQICNVAVSPKINLIRITRIIDDRDFGDMLIVWLLNRSNGAI